MGKCIMLTSYSHAAQQQDRKQGKKWDFHHICRIESKTKNTKLENICWHPMKIFGLLGTTLKTAAVVDYQGTPNAETTIVSMDINYTVT